MTKFVLISCSLALLLSCGDDKKPTGNDDYTSAIAAGGESEEQLKDQLKQFEAEEAKRLEEQRKNSTLMEFDKMRHDFGDVKQGSSNICQFKVFNKGSIPLIISDVKASCGCTTPKKPEKPIPPGGSDFIEVGFAPKPGQENEIIKTVTVTANTMPKESKIEIRAFVLPE